MFAAASLRTKSEDAGALSNLGRLALQQGDLTGGIEWLAKSLQVKPEQPDVLAVRSVGLRLLGRLDEALLSCDQALALKPDYVEAYYDRGTILQGLGRLDEALISYEQAIALRPVYAEAHYGRGTVLQQLDRLDEALASCDRAIRLRPDYAEAHNNRGALLQQLDRLEEALAALDRAILLRPNHAEALSNRSVVWLALKQADKALIDAEQAVALKPRYSQAHTNRGAALYELKRLNDAIESYDRAIGLDPGADTAHSGKSTAKLMLGEYEEGWRLYEWRWKTAQRRYATNFAQPQWLGDRSLAGKTLLIHAEQGIGDLIQFCRYVPMVSALGADVVLEVPGSLLTLISTLDGRFETIETGAPLPPFDLHCPLMSLPHAFKTTLATVPAQVPYLQADREKESEWRERLGARTRPRVGLVWSGSTKYRDDRFRSIPLHLTAPIWSQRLELHSIQKELRAEDAAILRDAPISVHSDRLHDYADTAALIRHMDLVISVDTSVAHLAGALGAPVWILLPSVPDFRWMLDRADSPWYPTARLFRQCTPGDWAGVIAQVCERLIDIEVR